MVRTTLLTSYRPKSASALPGSYKNKLPLSLFSVALLNLAMGIIYIFRLENNPPAQNVEAFWQAGEG